MTIDTLLSAEPLDTAALRARVAGAESGAVVAFDGTARTVSSITEGKPVKQLSYEAYDEMARRLLENIARDTAARFGVDAIALAHRTGAVAIGESALYCACAARHRAEAFDACRYAVERVKAELPVWKKEVYADGTEYVGRGA